MPLPQRLQEIRDGFERPFWVANISEIFERLSYYGAFSSLALYLHEKLNFSIEQTGTLAGIFGGAVWFLAIFGGTVADWLGFRRALSLAYLILSGAYFLLGSIGTPWLSPVRHAMPLGLFVASCSFCPRWEFRWSSLVSSARLRAPLKRTCVPSDIRSTTRWSTSAAPSDLLSLTGRTQNLASKMSFASLPSASSPWSFLSWFFFENQRRRPAPRPLLHSHSPRKTSSPCFPILSS